MNYCDCQTFLLNILNLFQIFYNITEIPVINDLVINTSLNNDVVNKALEND